MVVPDRVDASSSWWNRVWALPVTLRTVFVLSCIQSVAQAGLWVGYAYGIACGVLSLVVSILGMVAAFRQHRQLMLAYMVAIGVLTILFLVFGVIQVGVHAL